MKRLFALFVTLASALSLSAAAQPAATTTHAPSAGAARIAVIAFQVAVAQTNEFQRDFADLQKKYTPKRDQIKTLSDEVTSLQKQLQAQGATLSDTERANRTRSIEEKQKDLQRTAEDAQNDFKQDMQDTFNTVANKVGKEMIAYAQAHGFTVVLDEGQQQDQVVLYANPGTDITKAVIDDYNTKSGIPAPPPQPASAAPATRSPAGK